MFTEQDRFDRTIGRLDRVLSEMIYDSQLDVIDEANRQTLKHHAEDMIGAGQKILKCLGYAPCFHGDKFPCRKYGSRHNECDYTGMATPDTTLIR